MSDTTGSQSTPLLENSKRYLQLPVDRLKKEEDEDQWISGEELFTEGSSDEDDPALSTRRKKRDKSPKFMRKTHHRETGDGHQESKQEKSSKVKESATPKARNIPTILEPNQKNPADFSESSLSSNTGSHFFEPQETSSRSQEESNTEREEGDERTSDGHVSTSDPDSRVRLVKNKYEDRNAFRCGAGEVPTCDTHSGDSPILKDFLEEGIFPSVSKLEPTFKKDPVLRNTYLKMKKLDALLQQSEARLKVATEETCKLRTEMRIKLDEIKKSGPQSRAVTESTKSFMNLYPVNIEAFNDQADSGGQGDTDNLMGESETTDVDRESEEDDYIDEEFIAKGENVPIFKTEPQLKIDNSKQSTLNHPKQKNKQFKKNIKQEPFENAALALTEEDKLRLEVLLKDLNENGEDVRCASVDVIPSYESVSEGYTLDQDSLDRIGRINSELELYRGGSSANLHVMELSDSQGAANSDDGRGWRDFFQTKRLCEINQRLHHLSHTNEEVQPMDEAEIKQLCASSLSDITLNNSAGSCNSFISLGETLSAEPSSEDCTSNSQLVPDCVVAELVPKNTIQRILEEALKCMPNFLFRHRTLVDEPIPEEDEDVE